jgi:hypothetical protein
MLEEATPRRRKDDKDGEENENILNQFPALSMEDGEESDEDPDGDTL